MRLYRTAWEHGWFIERQPLRLSTEVRDRIVIFVETSGIKKKALCRGAGGGRRERPCACPFEYTFVARTCLHRPRYVLVWHWIGGPLLVKMLDDGSDSIIGTHEAEFQDELARREQADILHALQVVAPRQYAHLHKKSGPVVSAQLCTTLEECVLNLASGPAAQHGRAHAVFLRATELVHLVQDGEGALR